MTTTTTMTTNPKPAALLPVVPEFAEVPRAAALAARLSEIGDALQAAKQRRQHLREELAREEPAFNAGALLDTSRPLASLQSDPGTAQLVEQRRQADRDVAALEEALRKGGDELKRLAARIAPEVLKGVIAAHRLIVASLAETLVKVVSLAAAERDLLAATEAAGWPTSAVSFHGPAAPTDWLSPHYIRAVLTSWIECGILPAAEPWLTLSRPAEEPQPRQQGRPAPVTNGKQPAKGKAKPAAVSA